MSQQSELCVFQCVASAAHFLFLMKGRTKVKIAKRIISAFMAIVLVVLLLPPRATAVETDPYYEEFGITYEQLFLYPQYLESDKATQIIESLKDSYFIPLESHSEIELWFASLVTALKE